MLWLSMSPSKTRTRKTVSPAGAQRPTKTDRFALKQDQIITAATEILIDRGLKGFTLADVAKKTGLITQGVGYYFPKKDDLAAACILRSISRINQLIGEAAEQGPARDRIAHFFRSYAQLLARAAAGEEPAVAGLEEVRALNAGNYERVMVMLLDMFKRLRALLDAPELEWMDRRTRTARAVLLLQVVLSVPAWEPSRWPQDHARSCERALDILLHGIAPHPGAARAPEKLPTGWTPSEQTARSAFLIAATQLINEEGYRGASVEKISARLNVSKGAFYHHNDAKDDVVIRCFERTFGIITAAQFASSALPVNACDRLAATCQGLVGLQTSARPLLRSSAMPALPAAMRLKILRDWDRVSDRFAGMISDGVAEGSISAVDPVIAGQMIMAVINSASELSSWMRNVRPSDVFAIYVRPAFVGLLTP